MRGKPNYRLWAMAAMAAAALSACSTQPLAPAERDAAFDAWKQRGEDLSAVDHWILTGKLSIDDGEDGGSGQLTWAVSGDRSRLDFRGALGRGAWRLEIAPDGAELEKSDGNIVRASSVAELVEYEVGWHIPVRALQYWALGLASPDAPVGVSFDSDGHLSVLTQHNWRIEYRRYRDFAGFQIPGRLDAVNGERRVKLAIVDWTPLPWDAPDG